MNKIVLLILMTLICNSCRLSEVNFAKAQKKQVKAIITGNFHTKPFDLDDGNRGIEKMLFDSLKSVVILQYIVTRSPEINEFDKIEKSDTIEYSIYKGTEIKFQYEGVRPSDFKYVCRYICTLGNDSMRCYVEVRDVGWEPKSIIMDYYKE